MQNLNKSINDADKSTTKLRDNLDKVDTKVQDISVSAKDIVKVFDTKFLSTLQSVVTETSKLSATITELYSHIEKAIAKNVEEGEKLAEKMEKSGNKSLSTIEVKAIEMASLLESRMLKIGDSLEDQSKRLSEQIQANANLIDAKSEEIAKKYDDKEIGLFNLKKHQENTKGHIEELKKYKIELEAASLNTSIKYDIMAMQYDKDSEEFKKAQEEKKAALEALQAKTKEVDKTLKESNASYLSVWKKQHETIGGELTELSSKIDTKLEKNVAVYENYVGKYDNAVNDLEKVFAEADKTEQAYNDKKYNDRIAKLDKTEKELRKEIVNQNSDKAALEKESAEAKAKAEKYREDIEKIEKTFVTKTGNSKTNLNTTEGLFGTETEEDENTQSDSEEKWLGTEEENQAAQDRIAELEKLAKDEEAIVASKGEEIDKVNKAIIESERSVLLEQMRIEDEKSRLAQEKEEKDAEIAARSQKRKEQLEKIEKIKAKAQQAIDIAKAISDVAKGVAAAWASGPFIGPPMAALVAIQGALQVKTMTEQLAKFEDGGLLNGKRHNQGGMRIQGTNIEVEGGEYVVNREATNKNLGLINYINSQRRELDSNDLHTFFGQSITTPTFSPPSFMAEMQRGGHIPSFEPNVDITNSELLEGMSKIKIEPRVSVTDINTVHENMVKVDEWTGL